MTNQENSFVGFEYMEVPAKRSMESLYVDSYRNFGWEYEGTSEQENSNHVTVKFKRDRKIRNKAELSRLQRQFENCAHEIEALERSRTTTATIAAFSVGLVGTALLGCSVFSYLLRRQRHSGWRTALLPIRLGAIPEKQRNGNGKVALAGIG